MPGMDFTRALYLGQQHESERLKPWAQLTSGLPAALGEPPAAKPLAARLAALTGCEAALLAPSTLHVFWDVFGMLAAERVALHVEAGCYPIARWGVERAACKGVPAREFPRHDTHALSHNARQQALAGRVPVVVTDGLCTASGRIAPLADYVDIVRQHRGWLVIDDTQALGVLGAQPTPQQPYGRGGGGTLRWHRIAAPEVLLVASLAKGFGAPLAMLAGAWPWIRRFARESATRTHCSQPSLAALHAATHALDVNHARGECLRKQLLAAVVMFRRQLAQLGLPSHGGLFPVQTLTHPRGEPAIELHARLQQHGVQAVLLGDRQPASARLCFLLCAWHSEREIRALGNILRHCLRRRAWVMS